MSKVWIHTCADVQPDGTHRVDLEVLEPLRPKRHYAAWFVHGERATHVAWLVGQRLVSVRDRNGGVDERDIAEAMCLAARTPTVLAGRHVYV